MKRFLKKAASVALFPVKLVVAIVIGSKFGD